MASHTPGRDPSRHEQILTRQDIDRASAEFAFGPPDPLRAYPELTAYLAARSHRMVKRLRRAGLSEQTALDAAADATKTATIAAMAMHRAIWRDLLPVPGVAGALWSQLPLDLPPEEQRPTDPDIPF